MTAKEIVRSLKVAGFDEIGQKGAHKKMRHAIDKTRWTIVPMHKGDVPIGTLKAIETQTGVKLT